MEHIGQAASWCSMGAWDCVVGGARGRGQLSRKLTGVRGLTLVQPGSLRFLALNPLD
jgi:hypothetical protein